MVGESGNKSSTPFPFNLNNQLLSGHYNSSQIQLRGKTTTIFFGTFLFTLVRRNISLFEIPSEIIL